MNRRCFKQEKKTCESLRDSLPFAHTGFYFLSYGKKRQAEYQRKRGIPKENGRRQKGSQETNKQPAVTAVNSGDDCLTCTSPRIPGQKTQVVDPVLACNGNTTCWFVLEGRRVGERMSTM